MGAKKNPIILKDENFHNLSHIKDLKAKLDYEFFENFTSENTKKSYQLDIDQFVDFLLAFFPKVYAPNDIERFHIVSFRNYLSERKLAPKSINRKLSAISSYLDFLTEKNLLRFNPVQSIKRPRQEVLKPTNDLSDDDVIKILRGIDPNSPSAPLHRAVLFLLFSTGIRKAELINIKVKDYRIINNNRIIDIRAKGGKQLVKVVHPECAEIIDFYMDWAKSVGLDFKPNDWLFRPTKNPRSQGIDSLNKPLRPSSVDYIVKKACQRAGIDTRISPHSARASYIGSALENGIDLWKISQDVGHSSVKTTEIYNKRRQRLEDSPAYGLGYLNHDQKKKA